MKMGFIDHWSDLRKFLTAASVVAGMAFAGGVAVSTVVISPKNLQAELTSLDVKHATLELQVGSNDQRLRRVECWIAYPDAAIEFNRCLTFGVTTGTMP